MMLMMLEEDWKTIRKKVILPLWNMKFKRMYEDVKLDYDDFESLAGLELTKASVNYDSTQSNIFTYATTVISRKARSECRNKRRQKRLIDTYAESLYRIIDEESNSSIEDVIEDAHKNSGENVENEIVLNEICALLKPKERKTIRLSILGLSNREIADRLNIEIKMVNQIKKSISSRSDIKRILRRNGYLGGCDNEI